MSKATNYFSILGIIGLVVCVLVLLKSLLIPLVIALAFCFIIITLTRKFQSVPLGKWKMPYGLAMICAVVTCGVVVYFLFALINSNINNVIRAAPAYQIKTELLIDELSDKTGISKTVDLNEIIIRKINIPKMIQAIAGMLTKTMSYTGMIIIYLIFLLMEYKRMEHKFYAFVNSDRNSNLADLLPRIRQDIETYITIKTLTSLLTGVLSFAVLKLIGVDFAPFWALIIFLLNFIPTIGSIIAVIFPILLTLIQFTSATYFVLVAVSLVSIQVTIGNIVEPRLMGKSLNLSPLVIILSLALWGKIWGITGMFLCVPIMVIINIILAKFEETKPLAILLSVKGKIE